MYLFDLEANPSESISDDCRDSDPDDTPPAIGAVGTNSSPPFATCSNLYDVPQYRGIRRRLEGMLVHAEEESVLPTLRWVDDGPLADPLNFGGWVPWRDRAGDALANYAGLEAYGDLGPGDVDFNAKGSGDVDRGSEKDPAFGVMSLAETQTGSDVNRLGPKVYYEFSSTGISWLAMGAAIAAVGGTLLGYRVGQRSGYNSVGTSYTMK